MEQLGVSSISSTCMFAWISIAVISFQPVSATFPEDIEEATTGNYITQTTSESDLDLVNTGTGSAETTEVSEDYSSAPPLPSTQLQFSVTPSTPLFSPTATSTTPCTQCGRVAVPSGKIVGGTKIQDGNDWPWFAALVHIDRPQRAHCGASLISPRYILTAAHCVFPMMQAGLRNFKVILGASDLVNPKQGFIQATIESATVHPKFEQSFPYHYDIGLIKLSSALNCTKGIRPVCLPDEDSLFVENEGKVKAMTAGFGKTDINGNYSGQLHQIELELVPNDKCRHQFSKLSFPGPPILNNMLCAWGHGRDACVGDSGSSLIVRNVQVGLVSWGIGCANMKYPGVYTKLDKYIFWIKSIVLDLQ